MNKKKYVFIILGLTIIIGIMLCFLVENNNQKLIIDGQMLNESFIKIYDISDNRKVYSRFTSIQYSNERKEKIYLEEALKNNIVSLDDILSKSNYYDSLNDGGTIIYYFRKGQNNFINKDFEIVCCDTLDGVKDVYIIEQFDITDNICGKREK